jgi:hypothetical protein
METLKEKRDTIEQRKGPNGFKKRIAHVREEGKALKWRKKDIVWNLKRFEAVVMPVDTDIDVFGKNKLVSIGSRLRLGEKERHGLLFYTVVDPNKKMTFMDKLKDRIKSKVDPEGQRAIEDKRKADKETWNPKHVALNRQWMPELTEGGGGKLGTDVEEGESSEYGARARAEFNTFHFTSRLIPTHPVSSRAGTCT